METIIQAGNKKLKIASIPIVTNEKTRESRLFKSVGQHVRMSAGAIIRAYIMYKPYVIFTFFAALFGVLGLIPFVRFTVLEIVSKHPGSHLQSLLLGAILLIMAFLSVIIGIISDLIRTNRILIEDTLEHTKKMRFGKGEFLTEVERHAEQLVQMHATMGSAMDGAYQSTNEMDVS